jgi:GDP-mannose 6-dehydrogenase
MVAAGDSGATTAPAEAIMNSDASLVCVGTPSNANGSLDLNHVKHVCDEIGAALKSKDRTPHRYYSAAPCCRNDREGLVIPTLERVRVSRLAEMFGGLH